MTTPRAMPDGSSARGYGVDFGSNISSGTARRTFRKRHHLRPHRLHRNDVLDRPEKTICFVVLLTNRFTRMTKRV
jgi:hypothetical protein